jgi:membrane protein YdbS with pleckstrin-like domain
MAEPEFHAEEILEWEFEYARETAAQAQNDRTTVVNLYLLLVGGVGSIAVALPQLGLAPEAVVPRGAYAILFVLLGIIGFFTLMKLVRLRQAWYESVRAMNTIKKFYLEQFPQLEPAFLWKPDTIPARGKPWTITFNLALLVAIVDSVAIAVAVYFAGVRVPLADYTIEPFVALLYFLWQIWFYFFQLPISENDR